MNKIVSVCGGSRIGSTHKICLYAEKIGDLLKELNFYIICGAGRGVMSAISRPYIDIPNRCLRIGLIEDQSPEAEENYRFDNIGTLRQVETLQQQSDEIIKNGNILIFFPGGIGTLNELSYAMATKMYLHKKIICIGNVYKKIFETMFQDDEINGYTNYRFLNYLDVSVFFISDDEPIDIIMEKINELLYS